MKKIEIEGISCQSAEDKHTFVLTGNVEINEKSRQTAENKQTLY